MNNKLSWGILGTGAIANIFAKGLAASTTGTLVAVASRTQQSADAFGNIFNVPHRHSSYEALLANPAVEAVYIAMPHPLHAEWAIKAAKADKHILCEKPIALNHAEATSMIEAAQRYDVFLMEAFMYRCHPQTRKLVELIKAGVIGKVHVVQATFSFHTDFDPEKRLLNNALGGGGILDVGGYCVSMARLVAGAALGKDVAEPLTVKGAGHIGTISRVDEYALALLTFPDDIIAQLFCGIQVLGENVVRIFGSEGSIFIPEPWLPGRNNTASTLIVKKNTGEEEHVTIECETPLYALEADTVAHSIAARQAPAPAMCWDDTLGNMYTLDQWRAAIGMVYDAE